MDPSRYPRTMLVGGHSPFVQSKNSIGSLSEGALAMTPHSYETVVKHASCHDAAAALTLGQWAGSMPVFLVRHI